MRFITPARVLLVAMFALLAVLLLVQPVEAAKSLQSFAVAGRTLPVYASASLTAQDAAATRAVIVLHGSSGNATDYYDYAASAVVPGTFIVAPRFRTSSSGNDLYWTSAAWKEGGQSTASPYVSSFSVLRLLVAQIHSTRPNANIVLIGHSAGGQFVQRYCATDDDPRLRCIVANPSSYMYLTPAREGWSNPASGCSSYNRYRHGLEALNLHMAGHGATVLTARYRANDVTYLLGGSDTQVDSDLDTSCAGMRQGPNRLERGLRFHRSLGATSHTVSIVPGVGHDARLMFNSTQGKAALAGGCPCPTPSPSPSPTAAPSPSPSVSPIPSPSPSPTPTVAPSPSATPSPNVMPVGNIPGWRQIFTEDFNTVAPTGSFPGTLYPAWKESVGAETGTMPYPWKDTSGVGSHWPAKVMSVHDSVLDLHLRTEVINGVKHHLVGAPVPQVFQLYGRYVIRAKADPVPGYKAAWLLWPHPRPSGWTGTNAQLRDLYGEIDFPEGKLYGNVFGFVHHADSTPPNQQHQYNTSEVFTEWHTYVTEWTPGQVKFVLDGVVVGVHTVLVSDYPMKWSLQTETDMTGTPPPDNADGHALIDWVAIYAYAPGT